MTIYLQKHFAMLRRILRAWCLVILSMSLSASVRQWFLAQFSCFVGISSPFLYGVASPLLIAFRFLCVFALGLSPHFFVLVNPLFIVHMASWGNDVLFVTPLALSSSPFVALAVAAARHLLVPPDPSLSLLWLIDAHYYTEFRSAARVTVALLQLVSLFLARHFTDPILPLVLYLISDPAADWASLALLTTAIAPRVNRHYHVNAAVLLLATGFVCNGAAMYAWWAMRIGNANFVMVGSLLYTAGLLVLLHHCAARGKNASHEFLSGDSVG
jgi:hypothetical protein